jgi:NADH:ubiquinone oxidoreductase subunit F (NADH-binding)
VIVDAPAGVRRLLDGPPSDHGPEPLAAHVARLGARPRVARASAPRLIEELAASGLLGHGGAGFPTARKWGAVAVRGRGDAVVVANGAEGEPASVKDRTLMRLRPHLVLDGLVTAAEAVGARRAVLYLARPATAARAALEAALAERRRAGGDGIAVEIIAGPHRYVAGEESAVASFLNGGDARPTSTPPRPYERGVGGRPTLVQNVETLAHAALVARRGAGWFRSAGAASAPGTALVTVGGAVAAPGLYEVALGTTVGDLATIAGGASSTPRAVLVGGYAGRWIDAGSAWPAALGVDVPLGAGVVVVLSGATCGLAETTRVLAYLAAESARQCGPCVHGVAALAATLGEVVRGRARTEDLDRLLRWTAEITGRGACHHPDGAAVLLRSALATFGESARRHLAEGPCAGCRRPPLLPTPVAQDGWR